MTGNDDAMSRVLQKHAQVHGAHSLPTCKLGGLMQGQPCEEVAVNLVAVEQHMTQVSEDVDVAALRTMLACMEHTHRWVTYHDEVNWCRSEIPDHVRRSILQEHRERQAAHN